jgi:ABC-type sugar transport system substrate-binding protein
VGVTDHFDDRSHSMKMHRMLTVGALALAAVATPTAAQAADQPSTQSDQLPVAGIWPQLDGLPETVAPGVVAVAKLLGVPVVNPPAQS